MIKNIYRKDYGVYSNLLLCDCVSIWFKFDVKKRRKFSNKLREEDKLDFDEQNWFQVSNLHCLTLSKFQKKSPLSCIFAETNSKLPDSRASARIIKVLDSYLGLEVDPKPLIKKAEGFEIKLKNLIKKTNGTKTTKQRKEVSYMG